MTDHIVNPIAPERVDPLPFGKLSGDWSDDDGIAQDQVLEQADHRPDLRQSKPIPYPSDQVKPETKIIMRSKQILVTDAVVPVMILPPDRNRITLSLIVRTATVAAVNSLTFADSQAGCFGNDQILMLSTTPTTIELDNHTGALWTMQGSGASTGTVYYTVIAVTL